MVEVIYILFFSMDIRYIEVLNRQTKAVFGALLQGLECFEVMDLSHKIIVNVEIECNDVRFVETLKIN